MPQRFTSWEAIYASLLSAFPTDRYHTGTQLEAVEDHGAGVHAKVNGADIDTQLLVAADGFHSALRAGYAPDTADLPDDWVCPDCEVEKDNFELVEEG